MDGAVGKGERSFLLPYFMKTLPARRTVGAPGLLRYGEFTAAQGEYDRAGAPLSGAGAEAPEAVMRVQRLPLLIGGAAAGSALFGTRPERRSPLP
ncbi:hypothetical protein [Streptomyces sp. NPDC088725]|uniref:hypothetical protein n=1 Tax=Streptomyces sp. NPDC088725 TaxID=3365873 RepID=UPI0038082C0C